MRTSTFLIALSAVSVGVALATGVFNEREKGVSSEQAKANIAQFMSSKNIEASRYTITKQDQFYRIKLGEQSLFATLDGKYLMPDVVDTKTGISYQETAHQKDLDKFSISPAKLIPFQGKISFGNGGEHVYMFSDPFCPHCRNLERQLIDGAGNPRNSKYTIHIIPVALESHEHAPKVIEAILCEKDSATAWHNMMSLPIEQTHENLANFTCEGKEKPAVSFYDANDGTKLFNEAKLPGTPFLLNAKGKPLTKLD